MSRILIVCKRRPQQRDLLQRPYGRFFHLPRLLAARGHSVHVALISHAGDPDAEASTDGVSWSSDDIRRIGWNGMRKRLLRLAAEQKADWVLGVSDAWTGVLAAAVARRHGARLLLDAYDDFESYMPWNLPLHVAWRRALRRADVVTTVGPALTRTLRRARPEPRRIIEVPMAADPVFVPLDRASCRERLRLPVDSRLLGYFGAWDRRRGTSLLPAAWQVVRASDAGARFVVTGNVPADVAGLPGVLALGRLDDTEMPVVLNAMDAAAIVTARTTFGRGSHPVKLCEAMACGIAVVATATEPVAWMLRETPHALVPPGDRDAFSERARAALAGGRVDYGQLPTWETGASILHGLLDECRR